MTIFKVREYTVKSFYAGLRCYAIEKNDKYVNTGYAPSDVAKICDVPLDEVLKAERKAQ